MVAVGIELRSAWPPVRFQNISKWINLKCPKIISEIFLNRLTSARKPSRNIRSMGIASPKRTKAQPRVRPFEQDTSLRGGMTKQDLAIFEDFEIRRHFHEDSENGFLCH